MTGCITGRHVPLPDAEEEHTRRRDFLARLEVFGTEGIFEAYELYLSASDAAADALRATAQELLDTGTPTANRSHLLNADHFLQEAIDARTALARHARAEFAE